MTMRRRLTVAAPTEFLSGSGVHTGIPGRVQILPAEASGEGIVFRQAKSGATLRAAVSNVVDTRRCTVLGSGHFTVQTVEHLLSACSGMGLTDAVIIVDGPEIPILDGSSAVFAEAIVSAGLIELGGDCDPLVLDAPLASTVGEQTMIAYPADSLSISVIIDYPARPLIGVQAAVYFGVHYLSEVAPARTYGFLSEIATLRRHGLALGAALDNGVALLDDGSADPRTPLRFANELARHKLLDVVGDLSLTGKALQLGIVAIRPSHAMTTRFAGLLDETGSRHLPRG